MFFARSIELTTRYEGFQLLSQESELIIDILVSSSEVTEQVILLFSDMAICGSDLFDLDFLEVREF